MSKDNTTGLDNSSPQKDTNEIVEENIQQLSKLMNEGNDRIQVNG